MGRVVDGAVDMSDIEDVSYTLEEDQVSEATLPGFACWRAPERRRTRPCSQRGGEGKKANHLGLRMEIVGYVLP